MGCEKGYQFEDFTRCWIMEREKDGTFSIYFFEVDKKSSAKQFNGTRKMVDEKWHFLRISQQV